MKKTLKNIIAASSLLAIMSLVGCGESSNGEVTPKPASENERPAALTAETDESIINELKVVNGE